MLSCCCGHVFDYDDLVVNEKGEHVCPKCGGTHYYEFDESDLYSRDDRIIEQSEEDEEEKEEE